MTTNNNSSNLLPRDCRLPPLFQGDNNLGQKVLRILHFLIPITPIPLLWYRYGPSAPPPWSNLFSGDQKWSSRTLTMFFVLFCFVFGGEGGGWERGNICSDQCFQDLCLSTRHGKVHFSQHFFQDWTSCTVLVKIVGTPNCLLTLPMLVCNIWWVNCAEQHCEEKEMDQK